MSHSVGQIVSPIDGEVAFTFPYLEAGQALDKLERAEHVQRQWAQTAIPERTRLCLAVLETYRQELDAHAQAITTMMGKPLVQARAEFESSFCARIRWLCEHAEAALNPRELPVDPRHPELQRSITREPLGVVLDIAAWNYPLLVVANLLFPAVLAGNAVLIKHAPQTALVADQLEQAFLRAGAPEGLVQSYMVDHDLAERIISSGRLGYVALTGSVTSGRKVYAQVAASSLMAVGLELGGKDPAVVLEDCDFEFTVDQVADGVFYNAGQSCCAVERIYVARTIFERFVAAFAAQTERLLVGDPRDSATTLGPVVNKAAAQRIDINFREALHAGAKSVTDDHRFQVPKRGGCYLPPRVLINVDQSMTVMRKETFGPLVGILAFDGDDQAVSLANDSRYGLTASVWTRDLTRGQRLAERLHAGTVFINRCDYVDPALPWSGVKDSGLGCSLSELGFLELTRPKSYHFRSIRSGARS